ncbi:MAG: hypothetical protein EOP85_03075 [Verrucomicrobiaceae bacterium]|nr:MAG: hypothetical protein EOP85_03075 [Verrucomicrobiaceae bacterium]
MKNVYTSLLALALTASAQAAITAGTSIYVDFGGNNQFNGLTTTSPAGGVYWNNAIGTVLAGGGGAVNAPADLVSSTNQSTGVGLTFSNNWQTNGGDANAGGAGGLMSPSSALLGEFAVATVTRDYIFLNATDSGSSATFTFSNLDTSLVYNFKIFATRQQTETRVTQYQIGSTVVNLQTSGAGIGNGGYNGNNDTFAYFTNVVPNQSGQIQVTLRNQTSSFGYIAALQLTAVPEPGAAVLGGLGGLLLLAKRRRSAR